MHQNFAPVTELNLSAMFQSRIEYVYTRNIDGSADMIETGTITSVNELKNGKLQIYVTPDNPNRMAKYRTAEDDIIRYLHTQQTETVVA